ncbi:methyl-accepting chemotaxis protein [Aminipila butyrica]|uniref:Methyl-accepting chemotaxis protein n=1 Tax=Aminipila butyrica TaxID=433296 RepID=A0A858BTY6_9FIRM|nr:methyl-accepting chemotaxis protein [Aminipila butyrica]QIB68538.1 methyl-accepting chemotaxis protein [Aminipila butyrica]
MKNLSISKKLAISFSAILILFVITVVISVFAGLENITASFEKFFTSPYTVTNTVNNMRRQLQGIQKDMSYVLIDEEANRQVWLDDLDGRVTDFEGSIAKIEPLLQSDDGVKKVEEIKEEWEQIELIRGKFTDSVNNNDMAGAKALLLNEYYPASLTLVDSSKELIDLADGFATDYYNGTQKVAQSVLVISIALFIISLILGIVLCLYIIRAIIKPLKEIEVASGLLADGNLNAQITYESKDELGSVAGSVRTVIETLRLYIFDISEKLGEISKGNLDLSVDTNYKNDFLPIKRSLENIISSQSETFSQIAVSADQVNTGASQISSGAQALSSGATEQAATVEELTASIISISQQAEQNTENVQKSVVYVEEAGRNIMDSNEHMQSLNSSMRQISDDSQEISKITKLVEDIAFQTNILALNAAVEAARAGSAGKGFAVVADEVRTLAARSAEAAKQTAELIEKSVVTVSQGERIAGDTLKRLLEASEKAELAVQSIREIEAAISEQATSIEQINDGLAQVSAVVQTNAATAEENSASSEELAAQAQTLEAEVRKFKLSDTYQMK